MDKPKGRNDKIGKEKANPQRDADFGGNMFDEFAAEVATPTSGRRELTKEENAGRVRGQNATLGWTGIVIAFISLFLWPLVLGPVAAVIGFVAYTRGNVALGIWSIVIGAISFITQLFLLPYA